MFPSAICWLKQPKSNTHQLPCAQYGALPCKAGRRHRQGSHRHCLHLPCIFWRWRYFSKREYSKKFPELLWILVAFSSILRLCEHLASLPPRAQFQNSLYLVMCYTNLVADCDVTFTALLEDGWKCSPTAVSLA